MSYRRHVPNTPNLDTILKSSKELKENCIDCSVCDSYSFGSCPIYQSTKSFEKNLKQQRFGSMEGRGRITKALKLLRKSSRRASPNPKNVKKKLEIFTQQISSTPSYYLLK